MEGSSEDTVDPIVEASDRRGDVDDAKTSVLITVLHDANGAGISEEVVAKK